MTKILDYRQELIKYHVKDSVCNYILPIEDAIEIGLRYNLFPSTMPTFMKYDVMGMVKEDMSKVLEYSENNMKDIGYYKFYIGDGNEIFMRENSETAYYSVFNIEKGCYELGFNTSAQYLRFISHYAKELDNILSSLSSQEMEKTEDVYLNEEILKPLYVLIGRKESVDYTFKKLLKEGIIIEVDNHYVFVDDDKGYKTTAFALMANEKWKLAKNCKNNYKPFAKIFGQSGTIMQNQRRSQWEQLKAKKSWKDFFNPYFE